MARETRPCHRENPPRRPQRAFAAVRRRWKPVRSRALDASPVLLTLATIVANFHQHGWRDQLVIGLPLGVVQAGALMFRRTRPVEVLAVVAGIDAFGWLVLPGLWFSPASTAGVFALYALGRYRPYVTAWVAGPLALAVASACYLLRSPAADRVSNVVVCALTVVLGQYLRLRQEMAERGRAMRAHEAVQAERRRIARELHDVVAHHISVMNVLVGAARTTMRIDPAQAEEALSTTERTAREAMAEMRRLLAVLRADDQVEDPEPDARTIRLPDLIERARAAGVPAELRVEGEPLSLPATADLAVYRTVQEALTNAQKHASGAPIRVALRYEHAAVVVEVANDPVNGGLASGGSARGSAHGEGYGLRGMAERVALCGGELTAGPRADGGFGVHARIPVSTQEPHPAIRDGRPAVPDNAGEGPGLLDRPVRYGPR